MAVITANNHSTANITGKLALQAAVQAAQEQAKKVIAEQRALQEQKEKLAILKQQQIEYKLLMRDIARFDTEKGPLPVSASIPTTAATTDTATDASAIISDARVTWNEKQLAAINMALTGKEFCLIGAAGVGKTTTERGLILAMIRAEMLPLMQVGSKFLRSGTPSIAVVSFTRRAVQASKRQLPADLHANCMTIHKLIEFEPVYYEVVDNETGNVITKMRFEPKRTARNPITELRVVIVEESSMCSVELYAMLKDACPNAIFIFVGDIQQLPPVYGSAILGFKMLELPVVELTEVYRQALESPIIRLAHRILSGKPILPLELADLEKKPELTFHLFKKRVEDHSALAANKKFFTSLCERNLFNPETDVVLCPFNEAFGTIELNKAIAQKLGEMRAAPVWEIIAGYERHYVAVGDRVLVDKQDGIIKEIVHNGLYVGKRTMKASTNINRWGQYIKAPSADDMSDDEGMTEEQIERMLELADDGRDDERKNQASHIIKVAPIIDGKEHDTFTWELKTAGEVNSLLFSYALTVHKSQGSEWERVYFIMHQSHNTMCSREMLYTAVTRAKKYLYCICENRSSPNKEDSTFELGIRNQRIKGNTLAEKAIHFQGLVDKKRALDK